MNRSFAIFAVAFLMSLPGWTQTISSQQGSVMDPAGLPISGAYVSIVSFKDQSLLASLTTDGEGHFTIPTLTKEDSILVEVGCAGFKKQYASHRPGQSLHFTLRTDSVAYTLGMAEVSVKHSTFRMSKGQFIFQPHGVDLLLPNAFEVLKYVPMLSVSEGGGVSVLGKGQSTIYINGDKPQETGPALMSRLKNIRPKDVLRVEIIRTPGSKYSASMQGAIVNVVLRDPEEGWNGMVVANAKYDSKRLSPDLTSAFTFNRKKFSNTFAAMWYGSNAIHTTRIPMVTVRMVGRLWMMWSIRPRLINSLLRGAQNTVSPRTRNSWHQPYCPLRKPMTKPSQIESLPVQHLASWTSRGRWATITLLGTNPTGVACSLIS